MTNGLDLTPHRKTPLLRKIALAGVIAVVVVDARESFESFSFAGEQWRILLVLGLVGGGALLALGTVLAGASRRIVRTPDLLVPLGVTLLASDAVGWIAAVVERLVARPGGDAHAGTAPVVTAGGAGSSEGAKPAPPLGEEPNHRP